jgi:hypothetical protein
MTVLNSSSKEQHSPTAAACGLAVTLKLLALLVLITTAIYYCAYEPTGSGVRRSMRLHSTCLLYSWLYYYCFTTEGVKHERSMRLNSICLLYSWREAEHATAATVLLLFTPSICSCYSLLLFTTAIYSCYLLLLFTTAIYYCHLLQRELNTSAASRMTRKALVKQ